jgi:hypothetical protein
MGAPKKHHPEPLRLIRDGFIFSWVIQLGWLWKIHPYTFIL